MKKNKLSKLIITLVVIGSIGMNTMSVFATERIQPNNNNINIEIDNSTERVVKIEENGEIATATMDKINNKLTVNSNENTIVIDLNQISEKTKDNNISEISPYAIIEEKTFSNYEYRENTSTNMWQIRRPKNGILSYYYKDVKKTSFNSTYLNNFKKAVDNINDLEFKFAGQLVGTGLTTALTVIVSTATGGIAAAGAALAALGIAGAAYNTGIDLSRQCKIAYDNYVRV